jgi:GH15 family glucan-1,4-alpha-glucosidase
MVKLLMSPEAAVNFAPLRLVDGYLPIEDHGLIGDGTTAALVARDGAIVWLCIPRFDSPPLFCQILDRRRGGSFSISPEGTMESRQYYEPDTGVLVTEMRTDAGLVHLTDALTLRAGADLREDVAAGRTELLRTVAVLEGHVRLVIDVDPRGGATGEPRGGGVRIRARMRHDIDLQLSASVPLTGLRTTLSLQQGDLVHVMLRWSGLYRQHASADQAMSATRRAWQKWAEHITYEGPQRELVRRAAITLKLLDHFESGAMVAAPTASLPEAIGGPRNWDYRYAWIRDAAFSVYAMHRIGLTHEAAGFLGWVLDAIEQSGHPRVLYDIDGRVPPPEREDAELEGYRGSRPVRWGNAAADQRQHDVYGEIIDCAFQWTRHHGAIDQHLWHKLRVLIERARVAWREPDHGIWEVRTPGRLFTYSAAMCHVALTRGARLTEQFGLAGDREAWLASADDIRHAILEDSWDPTRKSLTEHLGGGGLDASLLALPLRRVIPADHPRMVATTEAIRARLGAGNGLLYRYLPNESPDGLPGHEGAFLLCSFWLADNLAYQGRLEEAHDLFDSLCARATPLGLLPEQIDPGSGAFLGNYPQAFSHMGVISSGLNLAKLMKRQPEKPGVVVSRATASRLALGCGAP